MADPAAFQTVAARLRTILEANTEGMKLSGESTGGSKLERLPATSPQDYVAGTRIGKTYVTYYFMPVYALPELAVDLSPELRRRMHGKGCFNFTKVDEALFAELGELTARGIARYRTFEWPPRSPR